MQCCTTMTERLKRTTGHNSEDSRPNHFWLKVGVIVIAWRLRPFCALKYAKDSDRRSQKAGPKSELLTEIHTVKIFNAEVNA